MRTLMMTVLLAAGTVFTGVSAQESPRNVFTEGDFHTGCNYWASDAGLYMWRRWNPEAVEKDLSELSQYGVGLLRVFPLWPDFQPLTALYGGGGSFRGFYQNDRPLSNAAGVDEEMMYRFRFLCDTARKHNIKLVVGLLTGWMSGRLFVPPALEGRNVLTDPVAVQWEVRFVRHFVREMKDHPAITAWDLGNECNCMASAGSSAGAWGWMNQIASAIRSEDSSRPVVSGMHSISTKRDAVWNLRDQGELMDVLTTHPYPLFTPECCHEPFNSMRNELHPSAESLLYGGLSGKPCFVEEAGDLGRCTASPERSAANMRAALFSAWANGLGAYVWWCAFDQQHLEYPPYIWNAVERELGLFTIDHKAKPVARVMRDFQAFRKTFPYAKLPPRRVDAVCVVSELEDGWKAAFGAFLLSRQAGFDLVFAGAESGGLPDAGLYILPSGFGCDPYTYDAWRAVLSKAEKGATVLISKGNETRYSGFLEATGNEIAFFYRQSAQSLFELKGFPGMTIDAWQATTTRIRPIKSEVLAVDKAGCPMVTFAPYGAGGVMFVNFALASDSVARGDCFTGKSLNPRYLIYKEAARLAGIRRCVTVDAPGVGVTEHPAADGQTVIIAVNYEPEPVTCSISVNGVVTKVYRGTCENRVLKIASNDAAVFTVTPNHDAVNKKQNGVK